MTNHNIELYITDHADTCDCNCAANSPTSAPQHIFKGWKGTTIWETPENPIRLAASSEYPNNVRTLSFTNTGPRCGGAADVTLIMYRVHTSETSAHTVKLTKTFNGYNSLIYHSRYANHDFTEVIDLYQEKDGNNQSIYHSDQTNTITFTNNSDVAVELWGLRLFSAYAMAGLEDQQPTDVPHDYGAGGTLDGKRKDYPCNYFSYGDRYSFSHLHGHHEVNEIPYGDTFSWTIHNPPPPSEPGPSNYIAPVACFFNINNTTSRGVPSGDNDIHYILSLNNHDIEHFYLPYKDENDDAHNDNPDARPDQSPGVDLTKWPGIYNDTPNGTNIVTLRHVESTGDVKLKLQDGVVGENNVYRFYKVANLCQDTFSYSNITFEIWDSVFHNNNPNGGFAPVSLTGDKLNVNIDSGGSGWAQAGLVTKFPYDTHAFYGSSQQGFEAAIDVDMGQALNEMNLLIGVASEKHLSTYEGIDALQDNPIDYNNWYRIHKNRFGNQTIVIQNKLGGTISEKVRIPWAGSTGQLKIKVSTGSIAFYENGIMRYAEPYALPQDECYIYAFASSDRPNHTGTAAFDNYSLRPAKIFRTEFNNGSFDGWVSDSASGSWAIQNGMMQSTVENAHAHYYLVPSNNRHIRADIKTTSSTGPDNVARLMVKEVDGNNYIAAYITTDHYVKLVLCYGGQMYSPFKELSSLNPSDLNRMAVSVIGTNAKVWVNGQLYINADHAHFADFTGNVYAGLYTPESTGAYDYVAIFDENDYHTIMASTGSQAGGSIVPAGAVQVKEGTNKSFSITPLSGHRTEVNVDGIDQGAVTTYTFNSVVDSHKIEAAFIECEACQACESCQDCQGCQNCITCVAAVSCWPACVACMEACYIVCQACMNACQDCQTGCEVACQEACVIACQNCQTTCETVCEDCQTCVTCQNSESCPPGYYTCQGCETCQPCYSCQSACELACQNCQTGCQVSCQDCQVCVTCQNVETCPLGYYTCQGCETCQPCYSCQTCNTCQTTCELACQNCQTGCEVGCQNCQMCVTCQNSQCGGTGYYTCSGCETCQPCYSCQGCETACQDCQTTCELACQNCQTGCEVACQTGCEVTCQTGCEVSCQTGCEVACQTGCELSCQSCVTCVSCQASQGCPEGYYTCQGCETCQPCYTCQSACELACQNCQSGCEVSCQTTCEVSCQGCETCVDCQTIQTCPPGYYTCQGCETCQPCYSCQSACELACQNCQTGCEITCQIGCQVTCQTGCQVSCQTGCEVSCQTTCEVTCQGCETCVNCETSQGCPIPYYTCSGCETCQPCYTCQTTCELACQNCQTGCQVSCQSTCQVSCQGCETCVDCQTIQTCPPGWYTCPGCETCQPCYSCQAACELACQNCQTGCQVSCQTGCEVTCQTGCQVSCQTGCQVSCQTGCEVSCQSCITCVSCEVSQWCPPGYYTCQGCETCQPCYSCQTTCQVSCQGCQSACDTSCQSSCQVYCQDCQTCYTSCEMDQWCPPGYYTP